MEFTDLLSLVQMVGSALAGGGIGGYLSYRIRSRKVNISETDQDIQEIREGRETWKEIVANLETRVERLEQELDSERNLRTTAELQAAKSKVREQHYKDRIARLQIALREHQKIPPALKGPVTSPIFEDDT